jgi:hypothetical protein
LNRREIDGREIADWKRAVRDEAEHRNGRHQEARRDRAPDENLADVHASIAARSG